MSMKMSRSLVLTVALLMLALITVGTKPANSQIVMSEGLFRVVSVDKENFRLGITKLDDNPSIRRNWVYIKIDTNVTQRTENDGWFSDAQISPSEVFEVVEPGTVIKVSGGRGWDTSISAKSLMIYPDDEASWDNDEP